MSVAQTQRRDLDLRDSVRLPAQWHGLPVDWLSDLQIQPPFQSQMIVDFEFSIELKSGRSVRWQSVSELLPKHTPYT